MYGYITFLNGYLSRPNPARQLSNRSGENTRSSSSVERRLCYQTIDTDIFPINSLLTQEIYYFIGDVGGFSINHQGWATGNVPLIIGFIRIINQGVAVTREIDEDRSCVQVRRYVELGITAALWRRGRETCIFSFIRQRVFL